MNQSFCAPGSTYMLKLGPSGIEIVPVQSGALPYENNELDMTSLQTGDLKRLRDDPRLKGQVFHYPFPGTWYLTPQVTKPPFDNVKVRRAVAHAIDRENVVRVADGFAVPAHAMIPPGFPGAVDDKKIRDIQRFDPKAAMAQLKGTMYEGGRNWPKITLTMREEGLGSKPLAEAVQAVLLEHPQYLAMPDLARTATASSFGAALEMAREGVVDISQAKPFAPIYVRRRANGEEQRRA